MRLIGILVLLAGCGHAGPLCQTRCGMLLMNEPEDQGGPLYKNKQPKWTCAEFQRAEDTVLAAYAKHVTDPRFETVCSRLNRWPVFVNESKNWEVTGTLVSGMTYCVATYPRTEVGNAPPLRGSLVHELAHVVQECVGTGAGVLSEDYGHANWTEDGIRAAESDVNRQGEDEAFCCEEPLWCTEHPTQNPRSEEYLHR